jgi:hypothetical protein
LLGRSGPAPCAPVIFLAILVSDAMQWSKELGLTILACSNC